MSVWCDKKTVVKTLLDNSKMIIMRRKEAPGGSCRWVEHGAVLWSQLAPCPLVTWG